MTSFADSLSSVHQTKGQFDVIAVSKQQPEDKIEEALRVGHRVFGENRLQEAQNRWLKYQKNYPDLQLHFVGTIQSNKVKDIVSLFDCIHTIDRPKIAKSLAHEMQVQNKTMPCFIQVNTGREPQKSGIDVNDLIDFYNHCRHDLKLNVTGLMTLPPIDEEASFHFALLKKWADQLSLPHLSMGMSHDWQTALSFGATHLRLGTLLFGERNRN